ncbi:hypothetical protein BH09BAC3_BH09BAC3_31730 [soil metagenome]
MDQRKHWDKIGSRYDSEIFNVFKSDKNQLLTKYFSRHSNSNDVAIDFGCGTGKAFPYLSPAFKSVLGIDISSELLTSIKLNKYENVTVKRADLSSGSLVFPPADFVFCCNVIMLPEVAKNIAMIQNIHKALVPNGDAIIVLPSLESVMYSSWQLIELYKRKGIKPEKIPSSEFSYYKGLRDILQGIIYIEKVPTKHYSESEIKVIFGNAGLIITAIEKLEYKWDTEFEAPPRWMKAPFPWDWLVECKKIN